MEKNAFTELIAALKKQAEGYRNLKADPVYKISKAQTEATERIYQDTAQRLDQLTEILERGTENALHLCVSLIAAYTYEAADAEAMIYHRHPSQIK